MKVGDRVRTTRDGSAIGILAFLGVVICRVQFGKDFPLARFVSELRKVERCG